jgi:electron transfer flavoprotein beta subunit
MRVVACVRWVDLRPEIDGLTGDVATDPRSGGFSPADEAAVEVALGRGEGGGATVERVSVGGPPIEPTLRALSAVGADRVVRVECDDVAAGLASVARAADLVVCGDHSLDGGSGSTPAFVAEALGFAQALGLVSVEVAAAAEPALVAVRRLGGGRSERVRVTTPVVVSVEGAVASLRRAPLAAALDAEARPIEVVAVAAPPRRRPTVVALGPWRPRARVLPAPSSDDPRERIVALSGALVDRTPPRLVEADADGAADAIVDQLREWGYLGPAGDP